jgi:hypothetical protein
MIMMMLMNGICIYDGMLMNGICIYIYAYDDVERDVQEGNKGHGAICMIMMVLMNVILI